MDWGEGQIKNVSSSTINYFISNECAVGMNADKYVTALEKVERFSGAVLLAKGGKILLSKGYGCADRENYVPNTPQTIFRIASLTKQFTATAIMQLVERRALNVDDPISKFIPDYPFGEKITIHHLLTHSSGIPNHTEYRRYKRNLSQFIPLHDLITLVKYKKLKFEPGSCFRYSNNGYALLAYIIEQAAGTTYESFLQENIFRPLSMVNSGYYHNDLVYAQEAVGYEFMSDVEGYKLVKAPNTLHMSQEAGAGSIYSTLNDMYRWDRGLSSNKIVTAASIGAIFKPYIKCEFEGPATSLHYGYGWCVAELHGKSVMTHDGGLDGFLVHISRFVDDDACVIILTNTSKHPFFDKIQNDLAAILFDLPYEANQNKN